MKAMCLNVFFRTVALLLLGLSTSAAAEPGGQARPACDPTKMSCTPDAQAKPCASQSCLSGPAAQGQYQKQNDCALPASACGSFNEETQCCGKDPETGKPRVIDKVMKKKNVISPGLGAFTWEKYTAACPDRKQNSAPPDALWQQCEVGKKHSPDDDYEISEVRKNGGTRDYCIDGCSVPSSAVWKAFDLNIFLAPERNNPAGHPASSFYQACANHDVCYQTCDKDQKYCDAQLEKDAKAACNRIPVDHLTYVTLKIGGLVPKPFNTREKCKKIAEKFRSVLNTFGEPAFNKRRQQYCQCC